MLIKRQKAGTVGPHTSITRVTTPPKTKEAKTTTTSTTASAQDAKSNSSNESVAAKDQKAKMTATTGVKTHSFTKAQKNETKLALCQLLDAMSEESDSDLAK